MQIELDLDKDFMSELKGLIEKYGEKMAFINGISNANLNFTDFMSNFIKSTTVAEATIDYNANRSSKDVRALISDMGKPHFKLLSLNKIFIETKDKYGLETAKKWLLGEWTGEFYLHNSSSASFIPYCYAYDLDKIAEKGLFFIDKFRTNPPKHLTTFNDHVLEFISWAANRTSGAVGIPSYLVYSYYFWKNDIKNNFYLKDPEYYRRQCFQKFIYDLNQPYLRVTECAFSNITVMDRNYLKELFGSRIFPDGSFAIDYIEEIIEHQKVFMEVVSQIREETMMTFPVITYSLLYQDGKFVDEDFARWCNRHNSKWYDANFYVGNDVSSLSNCCRLVSNTKKLKGFINSIGGTSLSIGSAQVNTINLRRIVLEHIDNVQTALENKHFKYDKTLNDVLKEKIDICIKVLDVIRDILKSNIKKGLLPNYTRGLIELDKQYNTIGITAMYEAIKEMGFIFEDEFGNKSYTQEGLYIAKGILQTISNIKDSYNFDYSINVEAVPAERANVVLAQKDALLYPEKKQYFIYSNQWIPLMEKCTLKEKIELGAELDKECGGGQISHINIQGNFATEEQSWNLLNHIAKSGVIYFAYNRMISVCEEEHAFFGDKCPKCGKPVSDKYTRVVGFLTPVSAYSKERKLEFNNRKWFDLNEG